MASLTVVVNHFLMRLNVNTIEWPASCGRQYLLQAGLVILLVVGLPGVAAAQEPCATLRFEQADYIVCTARPGQDDIRLFWAGANGKAYGRFSPLVADQAAQGRVLRFAMNAGMYQTDLSPLGLYVEKGRELRRLNLRHGQGNFYMQPNGVFYLDKTRAGIMTTVRFKTSGIKPVYATQSGPMLVVDGRIHPGLKPSGTSAKLRNGVGVDKTGAAYFVISAAPVTFHNFARLFRDRLKCPQALFLDGGISSLYAPGLKRTSDPLIPIGPIIGVVGVKK